MLIMFWYRVQWQENTETHEKHGDNPFIYSYCKRHS
jgi:hypothetical protein